MVDALSSAICVSQKERQLLLWICVRVYRLKLPIAFQFANEVTGAVCRRGRTHSFLRLLPLEQKLRGLRDVLVAAAAEVRDDELVRAHLRGALVQAFGSSRTAQDSSRSARYRVRASFKYASRSSKVIATRRRLVASRHLRDSATASKPGIASGFVVVVGMAQV